MRWTLRAKFGLFLCFGLLSSLEWMILELSVMKLLPRQQVRQLLDGLSPPETK